MTEEQEQKVRRAREVLNATDWLFDDYINARSREIMASALDDKEGREQLYLRARVAAELKLGLLRTVDEYDVVVALQERKQKAQEANHGR